MNRTRQRLTSLILILLLSLAPGATLATAQTGGGGGQTPPAALELDDLLGAGSYVIYGEVRPGHAPAQAQAVAEMIAPFALDLHKQAAELPAELKLLAAKYALELPRARVNFAFLAARPELPQVLVAVELSSPEMAESFAADAKKIANFFLQMATVAARAGGGQNDAARESAAWALKLLGSIDVQPQRVGRVVLLAEKPFTIRSLRAEGTARLIDEPRLRAVRERFAQDFVFYYLDVNGLVENGPRLIEEFSALARPKPGESTDAAPASNFDPALLALGLELVKNNLPSAIAATASFGTDYYTIKGLVIPRENQPLGLIPLLPVPVYGPALAPRAPQLLPAGTKMFASASLDFPRSYDKLVDLLDGVVKMFTSGQGPANKSIDDAITAFEAQHNFKIREQLIASLGHEVSLGLSAPQYPWEVATAAAPARRGKGRVAKPAPAIPYSVSLLLEVSDRGTLEPLLPRLWQAAGMIRAGETPAVEQAGAVTISSYRNFSYAFVEKFLVIADKPATLREIITIAAGGGAAALGASADFQAATAGGAPALTELYVSSDVMRSLVELARRSVNAEMKEVLARTNLAEKPISYRVTAEPAGAYHEMQFPKNLYTLMLAYAVSESKKEAASAKGRVNAATRRPRSRRARRK